MAKVNVTSPVGRIVQGSVGLRDKIDKKTQQPKRDNDGNIIRETFIALAIPKQIPHPQSPGHMIDNPEFLPIYQQMVGIAMQAYPNRFNPDGSRKPNVKFAMKLTDGDNDYDQSGEPVSKKEGFAGNWILKLNTRYAPRCHPMGKYDPGSEIPNPESVIKCGHWVRVAFTIDTNGVKEGDSEAVPGLFLSPHLVEYVGIGAEITSGPSAAEAFGKAAPAVLPAGVMPVGNIATHANPGALPSAGGTPALPNLPPATGAPLLPAVGTPTLPAVGTPVLPAVTPALPAVAAPTLPAVAALPTLPPVQPAGPVYGPGPALPAGMTVDMALAQPGYTPELLMQHQYIVRL